METIKELTAKLKRGNEFIRDENIEIMNDFMKIENESFDQENENLKDENIETKLINKCLSRENEHLERGNESLLSKNLKSEKIIETLEEVLRESDTIKDVVKSENLSLKFDNVGRRNNFEYFKLQYADLLKECLLSKNEFENLEKIAIIV